MYIETHLDGASSEISISSDITNSVTFTIDNLNRRDEFTTLKNYLIAARMMLEIVGSKIQEIN